MNRSVIHLRGMQVDFIRLFVTEKSYLKKSLAGLLGIRNVVTLESQLMNGMDEAEEERQHFENNAIIKELEQTYEQLLEERNNLTKAALIHKRLSEEVINGNDLASIAQVMFEIDGNTDCD